MTDTTWTTPISGLHVLGDLGQPPPVPWVVRAVDGVGFDWHIGERVGGWRLELEDAKRDAETAIRRASE